MTILAVILMFALVGALAVIVGYLTCKPVVEPLPPIGGGEKAQKAIPEAWAQTRPECRRSMEEQIRIAMGFKP